MKTRLTSNQARQSSLSLEALEDRWLPSAVGAGLLTWQPPAVVLPASPAGHALPAQDGSLAKESGNHAAIDAYYHEVNRAFNSLLRVESSGPAISFETIARDVAALTHGPTAELTSWVANDARKAAEWLQIEFRMEALRASHATTEVIASRNIVAVPEVLSSDNSNAATGEGAAPLTNTPSLPTATEVVRMALSSESRNSAEARSGEAPRHGAEETIPGTGMVAVGARETAAIESGSADETALAEESTLPPRPGKPSFSPQGAGLPGIVFPVDLAAVERGIQSFLEDLNTARPWAHTASSGLRPGGVFLVSLIGSAIAGEAIRRNLREPPPDAPGDTDPESTWTWLKPGQHPSGPRA